MVGENDDAPTNLGQHGIRIRHMYQFFQDSMAICRFCHKPDLFITMTANPSWPEIQEALLEFDGPDDDPDRPRRKQNATDRPDIVARVFRQKIKSLLEDIRGGIFGEVLGLIYTNEFQKRTLPHTHILVCLRHMYKIHHPEEVDALVSAQLPDPVTHPLLYETITKTMLHGPCGPQFPNSPCMVNGKCSKNYSRDFAEETRFGDDGYPEYI
jgi:hypothetical protein